MAEEIKTDNTGSDNKNEKNNDEKKDKKKAVIKSVKLEKSDKTNKTEKKDNIPVKPVKEKVKLADRFKKFIKDYKSELKKIVWPTREQVFQNTGVVLIAILFTTIIVGVLDLVFGLGIKGLTGIKNIIGG